METKKLKKVLLKILVSGVLFTILFYKVDTQKLIIQLLDVNLSIALWVFVLIIVNYIISAVRWKFLIAAFPKTENIDLKYATSLYFIGAFFNNFMPTNMGGDVYKVLKLGKKIGSKTNAFSATFTDRFLGVSALGIIGTFGMFKVLGNKSFLLMLGILMLGFISIYVLKLLAKKYAPIKNIIESLLSFKNKPNNIALSFLLSFLVQLVGIFSQYFVFSSIGYSPPLSYSFFVLPVITLAGFLIPSLNGIGVQDALYVSLFSVVGIPAATALSASILYHIFRLLVSLIGGILYAFGLDD